MSKKKVHHEEHVDETWLIPYADMLTLLLALFIVMFAMSQIDKVKYEEIKEQFNTIFAGGSGMMEKDGSKVIPMNPVKPSSGSVPNGATTTRTEGQVEDDKMKEIKKLLEDKISAEGFTDKIALILNDEGLDISIQDAVLFKSGDAVVMQNAAPVLNLIAKTLGEIDNSIKVVGHTDNLPIKNGKYRSNWDLSAMRSINVMQFLFERGKLSQDRFQVQARGEFEPKYSNSTAEGRAKNRRVEIIIIRKHPVAAESKETEQINQ